MGLVQYFKNEFTCSRCDGHFPRSVLTTLYCEFEDMEGKYCARCLSTILKKRDKMIKEIESISVFKHCDDCGDEYALAFLHYNMEGHYLCGRCAEREAN